ncbi:MAG: ABC transporter permease subunit [Candidatus Tectomicrobia bacterium]|nr:ABC transporter permease subunit [Candidatus Tectomicrobia bacterium]
MRTKALEAEIAAVSEDAGAVTRGWGALASRKEPVISVLIILVMWQILSLFLPRYLVPSFATIIVSFVEIVSSSTLMVDTLRTIMRIFIGLGLSFLAGIIVGVLMGFSNTLEKYILPVLHFIMGVPALSWVIFAIIWFKPVELRVAFILLAGCLPNYSLIIHDGIKGISRDYYDMLRAMRPTRRQLFSKLVLPGMLPAVLTSWKVNIGLATRVVIVAELVGATVGIGNKLLLAQELFDMPKAVAWTLILVIFLLLTQYLLLLLERHLLRWRPSKEGGIQ